MAVTEVEVTAPKTAALPPNVTPVVPVKFVPVIVTLVPPSAVPLAVLTLVTAGATGAGADAIID